MISIKDYAKENGITYEAVRQQLVRYKDELEGHIHKDGRTRFLDDEAVAFLSSHRSKDPIAVFTGSADDAYIKELEEQKKQLEAKNDALTFELIEKGRKLDAANDEIQNLLKENKQLALDKQQLQLQIEAPKEPEQPEKKGFFARFFGG